MSFYMHIYTSLELLNRSLHITIELHSKKKKKKTQRFPSLKKKKLFQNSSYGTFNLYFFWGKQKKTFIHFKFQPTTNQLTFIWYKDLTNQANEWWNKMSSKNMGILYHIDPTTNGRHLLTMNIEMLGLHLIFF